MSSNDHGATIFVTDEGRSYFGAAPNPRQATQFYSPSSHQAQYLIRNKGFAAIRQRRHGLVVTCRPEIVSEKCIAAMLYIIADANPRRLIFQTPAGHDWQQTLVPFTDSTRALSRVIKIFGDPEPTDRHWVLSKMLNIEGAESDPRFAPFLAHWKNSGALQSRVYDAQLRASLKSVAHNRYLHRSRSECSRFASVGIGDGFLSCRQRCVDCRVSAESSAKLPTFNSLHFVKRHIRRAAERSAPVLEHIDSLHQGSRPAYIAAALRPSHFADAV